MCFILILFQVNPAFPLVVAANREELRARPSRPPARWPEDPPLWAGRDEVAGGTWLGVNANGLVAALTNRRDGAPDPRRPSRGILCLNVLRQPTPRAARDYLSDELTARQYNPFNLLVADSRTAWVGDWRGEPRALLPGAHILTSAGDLDDVALPRVDRARELVERRELASMPLEGLLEELREICRDTTGPEPICRPDGAYGTVSSSLIALGSDGAPAAYWHAEGPPTLSSYVKLVTFGPPLTD